MMTVVDVRVKEWFEAKWILCMVDSFEQKRSPNWVPHLCWGLD